MQDAVAQVDDVGAALAARSRLSFSEEIRHPPLDLGDGG